MAKAYLYCAGHESYLHIIQMKYFRIPLHRNDRNEKTIKYNAVCEMIWLYLLILGKFKNNLSLYEGLCIGICSTLSF